MLFSFLFATGWNHKHFGAKISCVHCIQSISALNSRSRQSHCDVVVGCWWVLVGGAGVEVKKDGTGVWAFGRAFGYMLLGFCSLSSFCMLEVVASCVTFWNDENWWVTFWNLILSCDVISGLMGVGDAGVELKKNQSHTNHKSHTKTKRHKRKATACNSHTKAKWNRKPRK